ncbi:aminoacyl-tRNA hydrolase [Hydrogenophaga sp.]|uniref:aminoacyl-tRNA hydrolase n=1 Tax=Hydrogenophaga sp. TaxID=1904254 RepID=UPI0019A243A5|nr:aminoacyl-tRNA hydrolase [Hydrogenophaga sp.]MBD3892898.1 aminoacyl-tRNA hydrolase [Hydrogenophaga sp.]
MIRLIAGLGNPGPEYEHTRHNAGFWWVDEAARLLKAPLQMERGHAGLVARASLDGHSVWLLKPQTFMNHSGRSVASLARFFKITPPEVLVVHDELDLPPGEVKLKRGGGHAGHNGLRDVHAQLASADYWRLRVGIGHPGQRNDVVNWVLKKPSADERIAIAQAQERSLKALALLLAGDMEQATALIHTSKPARPKPPRPAQIAVTPSAQAPLSDAAASDEA